jgi:hypothetical protein
MFLRLFLFAPQCGHIGSAPSRASQCGHIGRFSAASQWHAHRKSQAMVAGHEPGFCAWVCCTHHTVSRTPRPISDPGMRVLLSCKVVFVSSAYLCAAPVTGPLVLHRKPSPVWHAPVCCQLPSATTPAFTSFPLRPLPLPLLPVNGFGLAPSLTHFQLAWFIC